MCERAIQPFLSIIGLGEDGLDGLTPAARAALDAAKLVFGAPRHLDLAQAGARGRAWPVPFSIEPLLAARGRRVAALVSGDPFWHGAGAALSRALPAEDWRAFPNVSTASLAAARLGWPLEATTCLGLHAAPFARARRSLHGGARLICLMRDAVAPAAFATWLTSMGFGASTLHVLERLGGARERVRASCADAFALDGIEAPVAVALECVGEGLPRTPGLPDECFAHDGQITKAPIRALTLSALAPRPGETLWDIGAGSGSISIEWALAGGRAYAIEARAARAQNISANIAAFGLDDRIELHHGRAPDGIATWPQADAVFIGGGAGPALLEAVWPRLRAGARLVVNAVTLETETLIVDWSARHGGDLLRFDVAAAAPLGAMRGWQAARSLVQWRARKGEHA